MMRAEAGKMLPLYDYLRKALEIGKLGQHVVMAVAAVSLQGVPSLLLYHELIRIIKILKYCRYYYYYN